MEGFDLTSTSNILLYKQLELRLLHGEVPTTLGPVRHCNFGFRSTMPPIKMQKAWEVVLGALLQDVDFVRY